MSWTALLPLLRRLLPLAALALLASGCASLPAPGPRAASQARTDVAASPLAAPVAAALAGAAADASGFRWLPAGDQALDARLALARHATLTLDAQYYLVAHDGSGLQFLHALAEAAARGVRVRLLVDDLYAGGQGPLLAALATLPHVEVRLFNPLPVREGTVGARVLGSLREFGRINRRMHNKLFVADNLLAVAGGRNVADEYFGRSAPAHFIDMDVLAAGPVVAELSQRFDAHWNSRHAWPVQALQPLDAAEARALLEAAWARVPAERYPAPEDALGRGPLSEQLDEGRLALEPARARVLADPPERVADDGEDPAAPVLDGQLGLLERAEHEVMIATPYLVPGRRGMAALRSARGRGVQLTLVTNSHDSTDEPLAHLAYARYREPLLRLGVELHEMMPAARPVAVGLGEFSGSLGRLHAKLAVADGRWAFVGSMNFDGRSARLNTELGLVIDSPRLAAELAGLLRHERLPASWRLQLAADERALEWHAEGCVERGEPQAEPVPLSTRLAAWLLDEDWL